MTTICSVIVVLALAIGVRYAVHKFKPQGWKLRHNLGSLGVAISLVYLTILVSVIWSRLESLLTMPLNEIGDFLAGAFGPIAIFWLVLGFFQQGEELKQGTKALLLQAKELKNSVHQQSIMANAAIEQIQIQRTEWQARMNEIEQSGKAIFKFGCSSTRTGEGRPGSMIEMKLDIVASQSAAHDITVKFDPPIGQTDTFSFDSININGIKKIPLRFRNSSSNVSGTIVVSYKSSEGKMKNENFSYFIDPNNPWVKIKNIFIDTTSA